MTKIRKKSLVLAREDMLKKGSVANREGMDPIP